MYFLFTLLLLLFTGLPLLLVIFVWLFRRRRISENNITTVAFFHPYCNAGGGGERVLWCAIKALQDKSPNIDTIVYTGDINCLPEDIIKNVKKKFNIDLPRPVQFVYLKKRNLVEANTYPAFTLLGQSLGSFILGLEAIWALLPDVYIDTMGYSFTLPLFKILGGCYVGCYVHYPTITEEMLQRVSDRIPAHNNSEVVARNQILTSGKLMYYRIFAWLYAKAGRSADIVMVNSSWTKGHILNLWNYSSKTYLVYPPCDVSALKSLSSDSVTKRKNINIISVGQFRPEKDHPLQLNSLKKLKEISSSEIWHSVRLIFIGSCRNREDEDRVNNLKEMCKQLEIENNVEFKVNISYEQLKEELKNGTIGLHAMWNEHFGIGVVECMAAGLIMVAHRSGGPKLDIVDETEQARTGYLAETDIEYAQAFLKIVQSSEDDLNRIRKAARLSVDRFSNDCFEKDFLNATKYLLPSS
uniref:GDP-Man:Man(3)GlcNAc(2)-PP-Dol alpha-1,2-mannosyltransferase n=1 Tax=Clastoptera arizonana TaxID=38151 RepID=A0A1B6CFA8_9HEMI